MKITILNSDSGESKLFEVEENTSLSDLKVLVEAEVKKLILLTDENPVQ
jgi:hypothetical protein